MEGTFDIIVIGCGSGGLSTGLFMAKLGFKVLMVSKTDHSIGGECLNDGCVPSKALIHAAKLAQAAREAVQFGETAGPHIDIKKVIAYVHQRQNIIREHENAGWLQLQGITVALGEARFSAKDKIIVAGKTYTAKKFVIATGSRPRKLDLPGIETVNYLDNESIFHIDNLPERLLVIGGGPIGIEIAQAMQRLGSSVTLVETGNGIMQHDDPVVTGVLLKQLKAEGITFYFNAATKSFTAGTAQLTLKDGSSVSIGMDAVFVGIGRKLNIEQLQLENAGVQVKDEKITVDKYLRTTNKKIYVAGDVAGSLQFSHAAELHGRILLNNFFSPFKKKLNNDHMSWVTFTDPQVASFGFNEKQLKEKKVDFIRLDQDFEDDDRAITDDYRYGKMVLYINKKRFLRKQTILGGTMVAPAAGELIQELVLANSTGLSIDNIFNKIYPYPVATRINQKTILKYKQKSLTEGLIKLLRFAYSIFS